MTGMGIAPNIGEIQASSEYTLSDIHITRFLAQHHVPAATAAILQAGIPGTRLVTPENAEALWAERRTLFF